ncbi:hypothetical protein FOZ61_006072 [Perkinsus olseni]|uniref:Transcription factor 25 n=3 Tax=Perkinsus olseni TaxID=32597 RepID=A0A7J6LEX6_PEROL|nr:hypothetical protein FOZ61_006072 [Perkinsus olseni]
MSRRQINKQLRLAEEVEVEGPLPAAVAADDEDNADELLVEDSPRRYKNVFAAAMDSDDDDDDNTSSSDEEEEEEDVAPQLVKPMAQAGGKKAQQKQPQKKKSSPPQQRKKAKASKAGEERGSPSPMAPAASDPLLKIARRNLNPETEIKRIFGSEAYTLRVRAENAAGHPHNRIINYPRGMGSATAARSSANLKKKSWLLHDWPMNQEEEMWPTPAAVQDSTLMMKVYSPSGDSTSSGEQRTQFYLEPSRSYLKSMDTYCEIIASSDVDSLIYFLQKNPFHLHSILAVTDLYREHREFERAGKLLRRGLYVLQCSTHPLFDPFMDSGGGQRNKKEHSGKRRHRKGKHLNAEKEPGLVASLRLSEDDPYYCFTILALRTLLVHGLLLAGQGCTRTALEVFKLLLLMDDEQDRVHALMHIDTYAIRSHEYDWLHRFVASFVAPPPAAHDGVYYSALDFAMPNFAFSEALARYQQLPTADEASAAVKRVTAEDLRRAIIIENASTGDSALDASVALMKAILLFPYTVRTLLIAMSTPLSGDGHKPWEDLFRNPPFSDARTYFMHEKFGSIHLLMTEAYAEKAWQLWKPAQLQDWLFSASQRLIELSPDLEGVRRRWSTSTLPDLVGRYADISKSEFTVNSPMLPRALFEADNKLFRTYGADLRRGGSGDSRANVSLESNPLVAFVQSLMPWSRVDYTGTEAEPINITAGIRGALDRITERLGLGGDPQQPDGNAEEDGLVNNLGDRRNLDYDDDEDPIIQRILLDEVG